MENPKLALIPSGYKGGVNPTVYSILPTDGVGDFDFSRGSIATRVNKDGLIETVDNDVPRLDWLNSDCPSLLLQPQRTNYAINSENTYLMFQIWGSESVVRTENYLISPRGNLTASRLQASVTTGTNNYSLIGLSTTGSSGFYTASIYIKSNTSQNQKVSIYGRSSLTQNYTVTPEWQRFSFSGDSSPGQNSYINLGILAQLSDSPAQIDVSLFGVQIEFGENATSLITTGSGIATRLKDVCINGGDADLFDITEGTFFVDVTPFVASEISRITLSNNTSNEEIIFYFYSNNRQVQIVSESGGAFQVSYTTNITFDTKNKLAFTFKNNEFKFYLNGSLRHTDTSGNIATGLNSLHFAGNNGGFNHFQGKVHDTRVYDRVLTEVEAIELTTI